METKSKRKGFKIRRWKYKILSSEGQWEKEEELHFSLAE
jgi:hypothetical protein